MCPRPLVASRLLSRTTDRATDSLIPLELHGRLPTPGNAPAKSFSYPTRVALICIDTRNLHVVGSRVYGSRKPGASSGPGFTQSRIRQQGSKSLWHHSFASSPHTRKKKAPSKLLGALGISRFQEFRNRCPTDETICMFFTPNRAGSAVVEMKQKDALYSAREMTRVDVCRLSASAR